jgi:hypothetical protein
VTDRIDALQPGQRVRFDQGADKRTGKTCAMNVEVVLSPAAIAERG